MFTDTCDAWRITNWFSSRPPVMRDVNNRSKRYSKLRNCDRVPLGWTCRFNSLWLGWMVGSHSLSGPTRYWHVLLNLLRGVRVRHRWVELVTFGLGWICCGWVGYSPWFPLAVIGLYSPGWAEFIAIGLDSLRLGWVHRSWVSLAVIGIGRVGLDLSLPGWVCRCWALFAVVGHSLAVVWLHSPSLRSILPHWPTCWRWLRWIRHRWPYSPVLGSTHCGWACWMRFRSFQLGEGGGTQWDGKRWPDKKQVRTFVVTCFSWRTTGFPTLWPPESPPTLTLSLPLDISDLDQPRKSGVAHIPHERRGGVHVGYVFAVGSGGSWDSQPTSQERGAEDGGVEVWRFVVRSEMVVVWMNARSAAVTVDFRFKLRHHAQR